MPFFSRRTESEEDAVPAEEPPVEEAPPKRHGFFGRNRSTSPSPSARTASTRATATTNGDQSHSGGIFRRSTDATSNAGGRRSLLHRSFGNGNLAQAVENEPGIVAARERVMSAEAAERDADRALDAARARVREAREEVRKLEVEAKEEARRARIKQYHVNEVSKRGKALGRHDP